MTPALSNIMIYTRNMQRTAEFYRKHFGFISSGTAIAGLIELKSPNDGASIWLHQAAKSIKLGHVGIKLMFTVPDVDAFKAKCAADGLIFGVTHVGSGYAFANAKDPDKNSIGISSRNFRLSN